MAVTIPGDLVDRYRLFSLYNSPYAAHDDGSAVDLYPEAGAAPSPVGGVVEAVRSVGAPDRPYAEAQDHLIVVDVDRPAPLSGYLERILHVDPGVEPGDAVRVGDDLGRTIRSGFFAPWVDDHLHLGFRPPGSNPCRASGSVPVAVDVPVEPLAWDGRGTVVEAGDTYVRLDRPEHPSPGRGFAGIAPDGRAAVLDGGFPHYDCGGLLPGGDGDVSLFGRSIGVADGRDVTWADRAVLVDGDPALGVSFYAGRDRAGAKVVRRDHPFDVGDDVVVTVE